MYFIYGSKEVEYLKSKDKVLGELIDQIGHIERETDTDLFSSVVHHIIGQQISTKAQTTIWNRMREKYGEVNAETISAADPDEPPVSGDDIPQSRIHHGFCRKSTQRRI